MRQLIRGLATVFVMAVLTTSTGTPSTQAAASKQLICHVADQQGAQIIEVADAAVPAHLLNHGDCLINSTDRELIGDSCDATDANNNDICEIQP